MEYICPLCNGIRTISVNCSECGIPMDDCGRVQDYYDDYSPYLNYSITDKADGEPPGICQHLFTCHNCGRDMAVNIKKVYF